MADEQVLEAPNPLNMSDEDIANFDISKLPADEPAAVDPSPAVDEPAAEDKVDDDETDTGEQKPDGDADPKAAGTDDQDIDPENPDADKPAEEKKPDDAPEGEAERKPEGAEDGKTDEKASDKPADKPAEPEVVDFEANWKALTAPLKANGKEMQITSVEDARQLMQMGLGYNKKMAALKPNMKFLKLLENNGLLSDEKISFLIDLDKKNPDAIGKLIKDSGIDPLDLNADKTSGYTPKTYTVDDRELELDTVLEDIQHSPAYTQTLDIVSNKWDSASKQFIAKTPQLLKLINVHVESGVYDIINKEIEREKLFGRLTGLSDIEAYRQVGDAIQARGGFNHLARKDDSPAPKPVVVVPAPKKDDDDKLKDKKRAASSTKPAAPGPKANDFNPLGMSDEEFSKQVNSKFL